MLEPLDDPVTQELRAYCAGLPGVVVGAALLVRDEDGDVVVVDPNYKAGMDLPGGIVEQDEAPHEGARREVREEIGLDLEPGRLLVVGVTPADVFGRVVLDFVFDAPRLTRYQAQALAPHDGELDAVHVLPPGDALPLLGARVRRRVRAALLALETGTADYILDLPGLPDLPGAVGATA